MNFAGSADDARIIVDDHGFLSLVALHFLEFEDRNRANVDAYGVAVAFVIVNHDTDHDLKPLKVEPVRQCEVISSWFLRRSGRPV